MKIYGIDFTSAPRSSKPTTCLRCKLEATELFAEELELFATFEEFDAALSRPGPSIAGIDLPFGLSRKFVENINWPKTLEANVSYASELGCAGFRLALETIRHVAQWAIKSINEKLTFSPGR
ncbi:MAG: hypothetical protein HKN14_02235 [Marinicaulis sp.]|nr:hypothetical protein [Marinicaulis sp.]